MAHALLSPSAAKRWLACPGSVRLCEGLSSPDTRYSAEGTFLHGIAARALLEDADSARLYVGLRGKEAGFDFEVTAENAAHLDTYLDTVRRPVMLGGELHVEKAVSLSSHCYGTADAIVWIEGRKHLHVYDLKMGRGVFVVVEENEQMLTYAAAALSTFGVPAHLVETITLHVVQPRCLDSEGRAHREWATTSERVLEHQRAIAQVELAAVHHGNAPLATGSHCRFCPAKDGCPQLAADAAKAAVDLFPDVDSLTELPVATKPLAPPLLAAMDSEKLVHLLGMIDAADQWFRAVRGEAMQRALRGVVLPGYKLVRSLGNRRWKDDVETAKVLTELGCEPWAPRVLASPAQVEKKNPAMKRIVNELVERPLGEPKLVPESDKRPAFTPDPAADFTALPALDDFLG